MYYEMDKSNCRKREKLLVKVEKSLERLAPGLILELKLKHF